MPSGDEETTAASSRPDAVDERTRAAILRSLLLTFIAITGTVAVIAVIARSPARGLVSLAACAGYALLLLATRRLGVRPAAYLTMFWYLLIEAAAMMNGEGIYDITLVLFPAGIFMGALLLDASHLVPLIVLTTGIVAAIGALDIRRAGRAVLEKSAADVVVVSMLLVVSGVLTWLITRSLRSMLQERERANGAALQSRAEAEERNASLQLVNQFADTLHRALDTETIAREAVLLLASHGEAPLVALYLLDEQGSELRLVAGHGFTDQELETGRSLPVDGSLSGVAIDTRQLVVVNDLSADPRGHLVVSKLVSRGMSTAICIPLIFGAEVLGTVNLIFGQRRAFSPTELETFQAIVRTVSLAIANARHLEDLKYQAFHDPLTSLPNRSSLHQRFLHHQQDAAGGIALAILDLKRFREINEALGHTVGDELLLQVAARLEQRRNDGSEVFRLGGDEFGLLFVGVRGPEDAEEQAEELHAAMKNPCEIGGIALDLDTSVGVAVWPHHGSNSHEVLRCADVALDRAKRTGRGVMGYARDLDRHTPARLSLMGELAVATREGGLQLHFQPKVSLDGGAIVGFEALVRWLHPQLGLLQPADFVPLAETADVINPLTWWVVENALMQLRRWQEASPELTMAVNLSVKNLLDRNCSQRLEEIMRRTGVDPRLVEFELTETAIMTDPESALPMLQRIASTGARLAIDDFGTGYSSLAYLQRFPLHGIKIDRSFVADMAAGGQSHAIVRSTVQLARSLGLSVVAEGIEDLQTAEELRRLGCDLAQGYFYSWPSPAEEIELLLRNGSSLPCA